MILVSVSDASYHTRIPAGTIRRWLAEGRIHPHAKGKRRLVDMLEVEKERNRRQEAKAS